MSEVIGLLFLLCFIGIASAQPSVSVPPLDWSKKKCAELGFKAGTEPFGICVLQLTRDDRPATPVEGPAEQAANAAIKNNPQPVVQAGAAASQLEEKFWEDVKAAAKKEAYDAYLESYPSGRYASLARAKSLAITADEKAKQPLNIAGVWRGQFRGTEVVFSIVQDWTSISITRIAPPAVGQRYAGVINGNTADVVVYMKDVAMATSRISLLEDGSMRMVVMDCFNVPGFTCAPRGSTLELKR